MKHKFIIPSSFAHCVSSGSDPITQPGLAITPADALRLTERGIPVSAVNASEFYDGDPNPSWTVPLERSRGVDPADAWEAQQTSRKRIRKAHLTDVEVYGVQSVNSSNS